MTKGNPIRLETKDVEKYVRLLEAHSAPAELVAMLRQLQDSHASIQRRIKDALFTNLFSRDRYLFELYQDLHPEDHSVQPRDVRLMTLQNIIANGLRNDLGFSVRDRLVILMEAQSTMTENIVIRQLAYLMDTWQTWLRMHGELLYKTAKVPLPRAELYVIFPGRSGPDTINLADSFFDGDRSFVDCTVKCIYTRPTTGILGQYIRCAEICDEEIKKWGRDTAKAAQEIRRRCLEEGILTDFMEELGGELVRIVEYQTEAEIQQQLIADSRTEGRCEGISEGIEEERTRNIRSMLKEGLSDSTIARLIQVPLQRVQDVRGQELPSV